jgi:hypothetical protein
MKRRRENDKLSTSEIMTIAEEVQSYQGTDADRKRVFGTKYADFAQRFPHLFAMVCDSTCNMEYLKYMLTLRDTMDKAEITFEDASKQVGQYMFDEYIKDKVKDMPPPPEK